MKFFAEHYISFCGSVPESVEFVSNTPTYYGIQYNHAGKMTLCINHGKKMTVEGAYAFFTHPNAYFEYGPAAGETRHHNFICSYGARIESYIDGGLMELDSESPLVKIGNPEKFLQTMLTIIAMNKNPAILPPRAVLLYEDLLLQMHESRQQEKRLPLFQEDFFSELIERIRRHPEKDCDFARSAAACHVTPIHFRRLFKGVAGMPPLQFQIQCRLQRAADLLISTHDNIGDIAEKVGIPNPFYFSRLFKERYLTSPLEYRREYRGE